MIKKFLYSTLFIPKLFLAQEKLYTILEDIMMKKYSMKIYCINADIFFRSIPSIKKIKRMAQENPKQFVAFYTYSQYKDKLNVFVKNQNISIKKIPKRTIYDKCVVDIVHQSQIIHTLAFGDSQVSIDGEAYEFKQNNYLNFAILLCPNSHEFKIIKEK